MLFLNRSLTLQFVEPRYQAKQIVFPTAPYVAGFLDLHRTGSLLHGLPITHHRLDNITRFRDSQYSLAKFKMLLFVSALNWDALNPNFKRKNRLFLTALSTAEFLDLRRTCYLPHGPVITNRRLVDTTRFCDSQHFLISQPHNGKR